MPIKPKPWVYVCESCKWNKVISPRSDALLPGEYYNCCPVCGYKPLKKESVSQLADLMAQMRDKLLKLIG